MPENRVATPEKGLPAVSLRTNLRELRAAKIRPDGRSKSLNDMAAETGIAKGVLSRIERGIWLPSGEQAVRLNESYGPGMVWTIEWRIA